jgi:magnesium-transporting ATPase (P-type)
MTRYLLSVIQINIFERITRNKTFLLIVLSITALQIIIVTFGSLVFEVYNYYGLNYVQWIICVISIL